MPNAIHWFEIPSHDLDKAVPFYEQTLGVTLQREVFGDVPHAVFPMETKETVTGAIVARAETKPGAAGVLIYLAAPGGVEACLARAAKAGARVVVPNTAIGPHGWIGVIQDLDGNLVGLHALTPQG